MDFLTVKKIKHRKRKEKIVLNVYGLTGYVQKVKMV